MTRLVVIGGKLQGTETVTLARFAGVPTLLIDRNPKALASLLADRFCCMDILQDQESFFHLLREEDLVMPAMENQSVLDFLEGEKNRILKHCKGILFDFDAYRMSSSKEKSDSLFRQLGLPAPRHYPEGSFPYIGKPDQGSGSEGVRLFLEAEQMKDFLKTEAQGGENIHWILQEFLEGPSYSIEITGTPGTYQTHAITRIHMDPVFDCCRVTTPCPLPPRKRASLEQMARILAEELKLSGIMDLEVIDHQDELKLLEIDARMPSQTPLAVYFSTGVNILTELLCPYLLESFSFPCKKIDRARYVSYEHYRISQRAVEQLGEHIMTDAEPLGMEWNQFGSDVVLSDYKEGKTHWQGIFINSAETIEELEAKRQNIKRSLEESNIR